MTSDGRRNARLLLYELLTSELAQADGGMAGARSARAAEARRDAVLDLLFTVGLITAEDLDTWRERFADLRLLESAGAQVPPASAEAAEDWLQQELDALEGASITEREQGMARFFGGLLACERASLLTADEIDEWRRRAGIRNSGRTTPGTTLFRGDELSAVIPAPAERLGGLRLTSVELYPDGVVARWHWAKRLATAGVPSGGTLLALEDDLHTPYERVPGPYDYSSIPGGAESISGFTTFTPAPPEGARRLRFSCGAGEYAVDLSPRPEA